MGKPKGNKRGRPKTKRQYPRTARLNSLLQQIIADYFEKANDEGLGFFTITGVDVDNDLNVCKVYISTLDEDAELLEKLGEHRKDIQTAINAQSHLRKTPTVVFDYDPAIIEGSRIDEILKTVNQTQDSE